MIVSYLIPAERRVRRRYMRGVLDVEAVEVRRRYRAARVVCGPGAARCSVVAQLQAGSVWWLVEQ